MRRHRRKNLLTLANESLIEARVMHSVYGNGKQYEIREKVLDTLYYQQKIIHNLIDENKKLRSELNTWQQQ